MEKIKSDGAKKKHTIGLGGKVNLVAKSEFEIHQIEHLIFLKNSPVLSSNFFCKELPYFSKPKKITHLQVSHGTICPPYRLKTNKIKVCLCCMRL
jgi:hypothetical protein